MNNLFNYTEAKAKLTIAFQKLRKAGYFARQNFTCCQSCGWAEVPENKSEKAVFYHSQDNGDIENGFVHLAWSGEGQEIVDILKTEFKDIEWDGTTSKRIKINFTKN